ncbi:flavin reductase family protein [Exiguobacterium sp. RIT452]|uniref:flavin reductase family protein n=1 Tax=Exiguobacterium sp. RIT452 TaxID=2315552 RepID=UPI000E7547CF|nr:flavin reductase family protein [Exiguobacterium sp. RIT452]RJO95896.1 flavin reductase family protein [Exiguobacterium sp. RIT452]
MKFDAQSLSPKDNYKLLIGSIIPRPIAFVTTKGADGTINAAPFSFFTVASSHPPQLLIAVQKTDQGEKDTAKNILLNQEYVIHIVSEEIVEAVNETAAPLAYGESELERTNLTLIDSDLIDVPAVAEAKIRFELKLTQHVELEAADLLIGEVVRYHVADELVDSFRIDADGLGAIARLAGNDYAKIGDIFTIARPTK